MATCRRPGPIAADDEPGHVHRPPSPPSGSCPSHGYPCGAVGHEPPPRLALAAVRRGLRAAAVVPRTMSLPSSRVSEVRRRAAPRTASTDSSPSSTMGWATVVRAGAVYSASSMSSRPTTESCSGTVQPTR